MNIWESNDDDFDSFYVLKVLTTEGEKYYFSPRLFVRDIGLAKKFNTVRSVRRSVKLCGIERYVIEKYKRDDF